MIRYLYCKATGTEFESSMGMGMVDAFIDSMTVLLCLILYWALT